MSTVTKLQKFKCFLGKTVEILCFFHLILSDKMKRLCNGRQYEETFTREIDPIPLTQEEEQWHP